MDSVWPQPSAKSGRGAEFLSTLRGLVNVTVYLLVGGHRTQAPRAPAISASPRPTNCTRSLVPPQWVMPPGTAHTRIPLLRALSSSICLPKGTWTESTPGLHSSSRQSASAPPAQSALGHPMHLPQHLAALPSAPCVQSPRVPWLVRTSASALQPQHPCAQSPRTAPAHIHFKSRGLASPVFCHGFSLPLIQHL